MKTWSKDELLLCLKLYYETSFGKMHSRNPEVISLANIINRTPGAVAWKLVNFASLDPELKKRDIVGAKNCSKLDRELFSEYYGKYDVLIEDIEKSDFSKEFYVDNLVEYTDFEGNSVERVVKTRLKQSFFRKIILNAYSSSCCISGVHIPELLVASHIVPWSKDKENRLNPANGLCLNVFHDKAFDKGLITVLPDYSVICSDILKSDEVTYRSFFEKYDGCKIHLPERFIPNKDFLDFHNKNIFQG